MAIRSMLDLFTDFFGGPKLVDGGQLKTLVEGLYSIATGITAAADTTQASATLLPAAINVVETVAGAADSVMLPLALPGRAVVVLNNGANSMQVFGQLTETIAPQGTVAQAASATGVAQASGAAVMYVCWSLGEWKQMSIS